MINAIQITLRYSASGEEQEDLGEIFMDQLVKTRWKENVPSSNSPHLRPHTSATSTPAPPQYHESATVPCRLFREWVEIFK